MIKKVFGGLWRSEDVDTQALGPIFKRPFEDFIIPWDSPAGALSRLNDILNVNRQQYFDFSWHLKIFGTPQVSANRLQLCILPIQPPVHVSKGVLQIIKCKIPPFWRWFRMVPQHQVSELNQLQAKSDRIIPQWANGLAEPLWSHARIDQSKLTPEKLRVSQFPLYYFIRLLLYMIWGGNSQQDTASTISTL